MSVLSRRNLFTGAMAMALAPSHANAASLAAPQPGLRYAWATGGGTIPGMVTAFEPDANGQWVNVNTGQSYNADATGSAGVGYDITDILQFGANGSLAQSVWYQAANGFGGPASIVGSAGLVGTADDIPNCWMAPRKLATFADGAVPSVRVARVSHALGSETYDAVRIQTQSSSGWTQQVFDLASGVLLSGGSTSVANGNGQSTTLSFRQLTNIRSTILPGPGEAAPQLFQNVRALVYQGQKTTQFEGMNDSQQLQRVVQIYRNGGTYLVVQFFDNGQPATDQMTIPLGRIGSNWVNPQALQKFGSRAVIDQDPQTGVTVSSEGGANGLVYFKTESPLLRQLYGYSTQNGLLMQLENTTLVASMQTTTALNFAGAQ